MPPWGRPPGVGAAGGVGGRNSRLARELEKTLEDVYRFQELDSEDERPRGVLLDPSLQKRNALNPDELYFNDMDLRAWERRTGSGPRIEDDLAYGDDYAPYEDEDGYYSGAGEPITVPPQEQQEYLAQRVMEKIQRARMSGNANVSLTPDELAAYEYGILRQSQAPAARLPAAKPKTIESASSSTRSKKGHQRTSLFGSSKSSPKTKPSSRKRSSSTASSTLPQPPGFVVPGPNGQSIYAPITSRAPRDPTVRKTSSPSRPSSRSHSISSRQAPTPPRELPGGFPSGSPHRFRDQTPPRRQRPESSSSRHSSIPDDADWANAGPRSRSSSIQQPPPNLIPFPVTPYQHYNPDPYQYHAPPASAPNATTKQQPSPPQASSSLAQQYLQQVQSQSQPQPRRPVTMSGAPASSDPSYRTIPRRVPVPVQRGTAVQGSYSDPALGGSGAYRGSGLRDEVAGEEEDESDEDGGQQGVLVDVVPEVSASSGYRVRTVLAGSGSGGAGSSAKGSPGGGGERRRRTRRK